MNKIKEYRDNYKLKYPYLMAWYRINSRCNNKNKPDYKYYGGKGIKNLLSKEDIKFLWERDKANEMKKPSVDRIKSNKNYVLNNCRIIEMHDNISKMNTENKSIKIIQLSKENKYIKTWNSIKEAGLALHVVPTAIGNCLKSRAKTCCGFKWTYNRKRN